MHTSFLPVTELAFRPDVNVSIAIENGRFSINGRFWVSTKSCNPQKTLKMPPRRQRVKSVTASTVSSSMNRSRPRKTFSRDHPSRLLWRDMSSVEPYPTGVRAVPEQIAGTSFFPGGTGLWCENAQVVPPMPVGGVMLLGHDFHSVAGYEWSRKNIAENLESPTWRNLLALLRAVPVALESCFFTNAYMGLREGARTTGPFAGACDAAYVARCRGFLIRQLQVQRPHLILALGTAVPPFLAALSPHLAQWKTWNNFRALDAARLCVIQSASFPAANHVCGVVALTHPCLRGSNVFRRRWRAYKGDRGELEMVRECLGI
jgi:uracil-DNA glycosylase